MFFQTALRYALQYRLTAALLFLLCFAFVACRYSEAEVQEVFQMYQMETGPIFSFKWQPT
jgi:hypothetical protein